MGGIIIIATADDKQCRPIKGLSPFVSPSVMTHFIFQEFQYILRTFDPKLQQIQKITRVSPNELKKNPEIKMTFKKLLLEICNFVDKVDDDNIPEDTMCCFPRNEACHEAQKKIVQRMKRQNINKWIERTCIDNESTRLQMNSTKAKLSTSRLLDSKGSKLPRVLAFFPCATFEFTYNDPKSKFFRSQLCMILNELPSKKIIEDFSPITVCAAPPGINAPPCQKPTARELDDLGWSKVIIGKHPERKLKLGMNGHTAIRTQYALRHRIAITVHGIMGSTVNNLAVEVGTDPKKSIWEAAMVVVILSRTRMGNGLYFIGEKNDVIDALWNALLREDHFKQYVTHVRGQLCGSKTSQGTFIIDACKNFPFRSKDIMLPCAQTICCYMLISTIDNNVEYVGWTNDLPARFNKHNSSSHASNSTNRDHLKPWMLYAYVSGFGSYHSARQFENAWQNEIERLQIRLRGMATPDDKLYSSRMFHTEEKLCVLKIGDEKQKLLHNNNS